MASLPIGGKEVENDGSVKGFPNIFIDSSILPSHVGESPQLTIMAFVASLYSNIKVINYL